MPPYPPTIAGLAAALTDIFNILLGLRAAAEALQEYLENLSDS